MTEETLRILIIQPDIIWKDTTENLRHYSSLLRAYEKPVDLILLPEMFSTGFVTNPEEISESLHDDAIQWLKNIAESRNCSVAGSVIVMENRRYYNRLICMAPDSVISFYNKRHLFRMEGEEEYFSQGLQRTVTVLKGWRICWQICYDLRFPVWSRNKGDYDVLVYVANWPAQRSDAWNTLLRARAIENQAYVIGVNRIGEDGNGIVYLGESCAVDPKGILLNDFNAGEEKVIDVELNYTPLQDFRQKFPVMLDADKFTIS
ncbi:MAG: amidohydrolase [Bacteroidales bacterium]|nr:amidohydrolase [Bacteroidales bacterium]